MPCYLNLLHGNFLALDEGKRKRFLRRLARSARQISDRDLTMLLDSEWRSRLTVSWLVSLGRREQFRDRLGELLLASELCYAGQGYCLALARFGAQADASLLVTYLDSFLPQLDKRYDQDWALGALLHIDAVLDTDHAGRFVTDGGPWHEWRRTEAAPTDLRADRSAVLSRRGRHARSLNGQQVPRILLPRRHSGLSDLSVSVDNHPIATLKINCSYTTCSSRQITSRKLSRRACARCRR